MELMGITADGTPTLAGLMTFSKYPQTYFPQLCITAVALPETRNAVLANILELLKVTENRYSGIPTMRTECLHAGLPQ